MTASFKESLFHFISVDRANQMNDKHQDRLASANRSHVLRSLISRVEQTLEHQTHESYFNGAVRSDERKSHSSTST